MTEQTAAAEVEGILALAAEIRRVDGNHDLGAAALAEALWPFVAAAEARGAQAVLDDLERRIRHQAKAAAVGSMEWRAHFADLAHLETARARAAAAGGAR